MSLTRGANDVFGITLLVLMTALIILLGTMRPLPACPDGFPASNVRVVVGDSMLPTISNPALIGVNSDIPRDMLGLGTIINVRYGDFIYGHRIIGWVWDSKGRLFYVTKGDNNPAPDPIYAPPEAILDASVCVWG